jgi:hypothetical protein
MAKRKDLLLKESTVSRMMGLAGIGALTNPFLRESHGGDYGDYTRGDQEEDEEEELDESYGSEEEMDEGYGYEDEGLHHDEEDEEDPHGGMWPGEVEKMHDDEYNSRFEDEEDDEEDEYEDEDLEEGKVCEACGKSPCACKMEESIQESMKRLKKLLEQAEAQPEGGEELPPEPAPGVGGDEMEAKIKDFVKKLGELVQETLGVEVTVEEGEGEPEMPPPAPAGEEAVPPAPMAEAINRLVNKVAERVKARLMEAKKEKAHATHKKTHAQFSKALKLKEKQMAAKKKEMEEKKAKALKEKQVAAKKKEMEMKKKKAAEAKKK